MHLGGNLYNGSENQRHAAVSYAWGKEGSDKTMLAIRLLDRKHAEWDMLRNDPDGGRDQ